MIRSRVWGKSLVYNLDKLAVTGLFMGICWYAVNWVNTQDLEFSPPFIQWGRLSACLGVLFLGLCLAGLYAFSARLMGQPLAKAAKGRWLRSAVFAGGYSLVLVLLAEDYARVLADMAPFSPLRLLPLAVLVFGLSLPLFYQFSTNWVCRHGLAAPLAVALSTSRWMSKLEPRDRVIMALVVFALLAGGLWVLARARIKQWIPSWPYALFFALLCAGSTYLWTYNKIVLSPKEINLGFGGLIFLLVCLGVMACLGLVMLWLQTVCHLQTSQGARPYARRVFVFCFGVLLLAGLLWWWAFRPGNMSADSIHQWRQAVGEVRLEDSHPILSTLWLTFFARLYPDPALFTFVQTLLCALFYALALTWFYRQGVPAKICCLLGVMLAFLPAYGIYAVTLWKDVTFGLALVWQAMLLGRLLAKQPLGKSYVWQVLLALLLVATFRHNGIAISLGTGVVFLVLGVWQRRSSAILGALAGVLLILLVKSLYPVLGIQPYAMGLKGLGSSTIGTVFFYEGEMPADLEELALQAMPRESWVENYNPYNYFGYFSYESQQGEHFFNMFNGKSTAWILKSWLRLFIKNPLMVWNERMTMNDSILFVDQSSQPDAHSYPFEDGIYANEFGFAHKPGGLHSALQGVLAWSQSSVQGQAVFWRGGVWWMLSLWILYGNFLKKQGWRNVFFVPLALNVLTLLLAVTEQGYRYIYVVIPYTLMFFFLSCLPGEWERKINTNKYAENKTNKTP